MRLYVVGLERAQRQVLELPLQLPQAEAIGERREDVHHFARALSRASRARRRSSGSAAPACARRA